MNEIIIQKKEYKGWKNCLEISNGIIDLIVTTDIGPRIIRFGFIGQENEFYEVESDLGSTESKEYKFYGGHRLWHAPEDPKRTLELDNSKVKWAKKKHSLLLEQSTEPWAQIQKGLKITMSPDQAQVSVLHMLTNKGAWSLELSLWALSMMAAGGKEIMPQVKRETGLLPNRMISLWPYTKLNDPRVQWGDKYITLAQDKTASSPFKIGLPNEDEWAAYANHGHLFIKQYTHFSDERYPDFGSSYETYTNDVMLEMETLSPLVLLAPGDSIEHTETWNLYDSMQTPKNEKEIDEIILPLIK